MALKQCDRCRSLEDRKDLERIFYGCEDVAVKELPGKFISVSSEESFRTVDVNCEFKSMLVCKNCRSWWMTAIQKWWSSAAQTRRRNDEKVKTP